MAHSLTINGIDINFTAQELVSNTQFTLKGENSNNAIVSGYTFQNVNNPHNDSPNQLQVIPASSTTTLEVTLNGVLQEELYIWTYLPETSDDIVGDGPTTPRGTEVVVKSGTGED